VFGGAKDSAYVETDAPAPLGVYGRTKMDGEARVLGAGARAAVVRTSWVFGPLGANFLHMVLKLAGAGEMRIVDDQVGRPTAGGDLARAVWALGERLVDGAAEAEGLFHYAGADDAIRADQAQAIVDAAVARGGPAARVIRVPTSAFPTPARRPLNARLDSGRINALGIPSRPWREAVEQAVDEVLAVRAGEVA